MLEVKKKEISEEAIKTFIEGHDPQERIVNLDYSYRDDFISVYYRNENDQKCISKQPFYPFLWAKKSACLDLCNGDRETLRHLLSKYNIGVKALDTTDLEGNVCQEMEEGYKFMFFAKQKMSYSKFLEFFKEAGVPVYSDKKDKNGKEINVPVAKKDDKRFLCVTPQEQFLISTGKRFFKGYEDYDELLRMIFDLETEGLDPTKDRIKLNGVRMNRSVTIGDKEYQNFERIFRITGDTEQEKNISELKVIDTMLRIIYTFRPDIITAHNGENFDWPFIIKRCEMLGTSIEQMSSKYFDGKTISKNKKESVLKLGGEVEHFYRTVVPGTVITDSLHAVRRAQATDSNFLEANLKYSTKYLKLVKPNRVYVPGDIIDKTLCDLQEHYAFNDENGDWYIYDPSYMSPEGQKSAKSKDNKFVLVTRNTILDGYTLVNGKYIVDRYLYDDLWECDKVEYALNSTDFGLCKIIPVPYQKCCTMGTAGQWKAIMMAWSYENNLAIPCAQNSKMTVGGLSRLLCVGSVKNVIKLDYNSLYPSIILTWGIEDKKDITGVTLKFLEYVLTMRETHKKLKKKAEKTKEKYENLINQGVQLSPEEQQEYDTACKDFKIEDNRQANVKKLGNSYFGSLSSVSADVYPWKSIDCGERTTSTGRQSLRLMISHFSELGGKGSEYNYRPLVGDSFTPDTPVFIKYNNGLIDIKPIEELINESEIKIDELGREYDYSKKDYKVLCRSGWIEPSYIYRHKTDKDIYEISEGNMKVEVTEDHSLFNNKQEKIKPSEINKSTNLEYYVGEINEPINDVDYRDKYIGCYAADLAEGKIDRVPQKYLNTDKFYMKQFYDTFIQFSRDDVKYSKTCIAGLQYIKKMISE